jgi:uncharacterized protein (TIGR00251 family)
LLLRVQPGARRTKVSGMLGDAVRVSVTAPPEDGRANEEVCALIARVAGVRPRQVSVRLGRASRTKTVFVAGVRAVDLADRIEAAQG